MTVRSATIDDLALVQSLLDASRTELVDGPSSEYLLDALGVVDTGACSLAPLLDDDDTTFIIGAFCGAECGIALARAVQRDDGGVVVTVPWLYVEGGFRRCGVAEAMVATLRALVAARGGGALDVLAAPGDRATKSLLEMSGMKARVIVMSLAVPGALSLGEGL